MKLQIGATQADSTPVQAEFDNILLAAVSDVPEPATWKLLMAAMCVLAGLGRRALALA